MAGGGILVRGFTCHEFGDESIHGYPLAVSRQVPEHPSPVRVGEDLVKLIPDLIRSFVRVVFFHNGYMLTDGKT